MEAQEIFYGIASVALVILSVFIIFFFYVVYRISRLAQTGLKTLSFAAKDIQHSMGSMAKSWGRATITGLIIKALRAYFFRR